MRFTTKPTISLEVLTIKMAQPQTSSAPRTIEAPSSEEVQQLQQQLAQLRQQMSALMNGGSVPSSQPTPPKPVAKAPKATSSRNVSANEQNFDGSDQRRHRKGARLVGRLAQLLNAATTSADESSTTGCCRAKWVCDAIYV